MATLSGSDDPADVEAEQACDIERQKDLILNQAAEIKRLEAELHEAKTEFARCDELWSQTAAQLAVMRYVMERLLTRHETLSDIASAEVRQALATDSGKAAADVLAAVQKLEHRYSEGGSADVLQGLNDLWAAWDAFRNEGRDDE